MHRFPKSLVNELHDFTTFVNTGANIGQFVLDLDMSRPRVTSILAIEPHLEFALVREVKVALDGLTNTRAGEVALGNTGREVVFRLAEVRHHSVRQPRALT